MTSAREPAAPPRTIVNQFLRFAVVGALGFLVDSGVLYLVVYRFGLSLYTGRVLSYLAAASFTWWLNRVFTFGETTRRPRAAQWLRFLAFNLGGHIIYRALIVFFDGHFQQVAGIAKTARQLI